MTSQLVEELRRTLTGAAEGAPLPGDDFVAGVRHRQRRRRNRRAVAVAASAIVITTVGTVTAVSLNRPAPPPEPVATSWNGELPDFAAAKSPQEVWPDAVHRLPGTLPDGRDYQVVAGLGEGRYLVTTQAHVRVDGERSKIIPSVFDVKANNLRPLTVPSPPVAAGVTSSLRQVTAAGDRAIWLLSVNRGDTGSLEVWSSRLDGAGAPRQLGTLTDPDRISRIDIAGDSIYWQQTEGDGTDPAGIYVLPISGGTPRLVPGSAGFAWTVMSPWVTSTPWVTPKDEDSGPREGELWNLATGERRAWVANPDAGNLICDPVLCNGQGADGENVVQGLDGTGYQVLPYSDTDGFRMSSAAEGRFGVGHVSLPDGRVPFVWDRFTGAVVLMNPEPVSVGPPGTVKSALSGIIGGTVLWSDGEDGYYVLDLKAIR